MPKSNDQHSLLAVCLDSGDTIVDEGTEIKDAYGVVQQAELIPGAAQMVRDLKAAGYRTGVVTDSYVWDATPAAFITHAGQRGNDNAAEVLRQIGTHCEPDAHIEHTLGPLDILDHASTNLGAGGKLGLDATSNHTSEPLVSRP